LGGGGVAPAVDQEEAVVDPGDRCPDTARGKRDSLDRTRVLGWIGSEGATPPAVELAFRRIASSDESCRRIGSVGRGRTAVQVSACGARPAVGVASHPDGSFAVMDGELFGDRGVVPADAAAESALADVLARGYIAAAGWNAEAVVSVWDASTEILVVARDRMGVSPAYWWESGGGIAWVSDLSSAVGAGAPAELDPLAVDVFLATGRVPAPWTFLEAVRKIPPGHALVVSPGRPPRVLCYWRQTGQPKLNLSDSERADRLAAALEVSLRRRSTADGKLGALLSSGVDSTLLVAGVRELLQLPLSTFTFRYLEYEGVYNEDEPAARRARHFGCDHERIDVSPHELAARFSSIVAGFGEPFTYGLHSFLLEKAGDAGVGALLSGVGPDGWYFSQRSARAVMLLRRAPFGVGRVALRASERVDPRSRAHRLSRLLTHGVGGMRWNMVLAPTPLRREIERDASVAERGERELRRLIDDTTATYRGETAADRDIFTEQRCFTAEHLTFWNHRWGRVHGIPVRHPYFDNDLHALVLRLRRDREAKEELRQLAETLMPREFARAPKIFQSVPISIWLRGPLTPLLHDSLSPDRIERSGLFDPDAVKRLIAEHLSGEADRDWVLWSLMTLVEWHLELASRATSWR
jgi:asparagine synthase (glutamine-hydrolysing)